ncbi:flagellar hook-basal body protein [Novosphingobium terrae]|uniref:flagellar hook-basal body protein n=1 Tax=Novosphingobium terrae TaxID=2726189 RepID=UPI00197E7592|nr:flagellar hook basal-body protein [Novosphingobium terrae]
MSYYTSLTGLKNASQELNVISNNLANAETTGFKKSDINFSDIVGASSYSNAKTQVGLGSLVQSVAQDFTTGSAKQTGSALDLMVNGNGFFTVVAPTTGQVLYTRNGNFTTDGSGNITDSSGNNVQIMAYDSTTGTYATTPSNGQLPITNAAGSAYTGVQVKDDGSIVAAYADGSTTTVGKVALASFVSPTGLKEMGSQQWEVTGLSGPATYGVPSSGGNGSILSGTLEQSNVDTATEMVGLITAQRYFQANAKAIDTNTQISDAVINLRS